MKNPMHPLHEIQIFWRPRGLFEWRIIDGVTEATLEKGTCQSMDAARLDAAAAMRGMTDN